jgi:putative ABC transport system permease protein
MITAWIETARTALEALNARRMRSVLTVLGILIGIAAVMLTVGLGQTATSEITNQINSLGSNMLTVTPSASSSGGGFFRGASQANSLTMADAEIIANKNVCPSVGAVAPVRSTSGSLKSSQSTWTSTIYGSTPDWMVVRARNVESGRFFTTSEVDSSANVAVIGPETESELFENGSAVGEIIMVNGQGFTVIGVLEEVGSSMMSNEDDMVMVPITTFGARFATTSGDAVSGIYLQAIDDASLSAAYQQVETALAAAHGVTADNMDFQVSAQATLIDALAEVTGVLTAVLGSIAAISLLVGGIGVMNIMLVSVSERVREIGLRKALGATPAVIRRQFLVEAGVLGMTGGILGIALGYAAATIISMAIGYSIILSPTVALGALSVSLAIGLVAGVYPAGRAARMAPIDALRSE